MLVSPDIIPERVPPVRAFTRFYTRRIGVVTEGMHETPHSLPEARVLYELGRRPVTEVADLRRELGSDSGHLTRLLARMDAKGLTPRDRSESAARRRRVRMTEAGAAARV